MSRTANAMASASEGASRLKSARAPSGPISMPGAVLARRAEGTPAVHLTAAADQLLEHLAAIEGTAPADKGIIAVLARAGAQMLMSGIELDGAYDAAQ
jgi:hypothetical protein